MNEGMNVIYFDTLVSQEQGYNVFDIQTIYIAHLGRVEAAYNNIFETGKNRRYIYENSITKDTTDPT